MSSEVRLTPQRAFRQIIIDEIRRHGGVATPTLVYAAMGREGMLVPGDFDLAHGGEARWKNAVRQEARAMRDEGVRGTQLTASCQIGQRVGRRRDDECDDPTVVRDLNRFPGLDSA